MSEHLHLRPHLAIAMSSLPHASRCVVLFAAATIFSACGGEESAAPANETPAAAPPAAATDEHAGHAAHAEGTPAGLPALPPTAAVSFGEPAAGIVRGPLVDGKVVVHFVMQATDLTVMPAGELRDGAGHHHILVDPEGGEGVPRGVPVPADATHIHFGGGQTEADVPLDPGPHVVMLQFADGAHRSYGPDLTARLEIVVEVGQAEVPADADDSDDHEQDAEGAAEESDEAAE